MGWVVIIASFFISGAYIPTLGVLIINFKLSNIKIMKFATIQDALKTFLFI